MTTAATVVPFETGAEVVRNPDVVVPRISVTPQDVDDVLADAVHAIVRADRAPASIPGKVLDDGGKYATS